MPMAYPSTVIIDLVDKARAVAIDELEVATPGEYETAALAGRVEAYTKVLHWFGRD